MIPPSRLLLVVIVLIVVMVVADCRVMMAQALKEAKGLLRFIVTEDQNDVTYIQDLWKIVKTQG